MSRYKSMILALAALISVSPALAFAAGEPPPVPSVLWVLPFASLLLAIAVFPLLPKVSHWWEHNHNKLILSGSLAGLVCLYYAFRGYGIGESAPGFHSMLHVIDHTLIQDFIPFIILLFSLYTISGGISLTAKVAPRPGVNTAFLIAGAVFASLIGTTGASMLLIRPLLKINRSRHYVKHTVVFFIFMVSNIGGSLLPVGDPPLFLGYLHGVPFLWTLNLIPEWFFCITILAVTYLLIDRHFAKKEPRHIAPHEDAEDLGIKGGLNLLLLIGVVAAVALLVPGKPLPGTEWFLPQIYLRELVQLGLVAISLSLTPKAVRHANEFNFGAIKEVAALFLGIFVTMAVPLEILSQKGAALGLTSPAHFFWASGILSSFLDNAPTYVVFSDAAAAIGGVGAMLHVEGLPNHQISVALLKAVSCGSVFMGANTYIGNGPNFMVKHIAEHFGVKMPGFFGYMAYSCAILIPLFILVTLVFFRGA